MKALVIYDSFFGNTEKVAQAVGTALGGAYEVSVVRVSDASLDLLTGLDLLVLGSPTRGFSASPLTKAFLKAVPAGGLKGVRVAAFDTRMDLKQVNNAFLTFMVKIFGYAAEPLAKGLVSKGGTLAAPAGGFIVTASEGPLKEGELERAAQWAQAVAGS